MVESQDHREGHLNLSFVFGLLLGGLLVFVLGTKKGRKLVEEILEEGADAWGGVLEENPGLEEKVEEKTAEVAGKLQGVKKHFFRRQGKPLA